MALLETIILAIIQGLTEFLPISSSAHLILPSQLLGWRDQGLGFDVAVHVGTLLAVVSYFRVQVLELLQGWFGSFKGQHNQHSRLAWLIVWATVPALLFGLLAASHIETIARSVAVISATTIIFGLLLWWADCKASEQQKIESLTLRQALIIGVAQAIALIPGTSRSGITITAGLLLGLTRTDAARFSFLMSIPVILMAGAYQVLKLSQTDVQVDWGMMGIGVLVSYLSAYLCIHWFLKIIERMGMLPFVIYRLLLGLILAWFAWTMMA